MYVYNKPSNETCYLTVTGNGVKKIIYPTHQNNISNI